MIERCDLSDSCSDQDDHELGRDELVDCGTIVLGDPVFEDIPCFGILVHDIKEISASEGLVLVARAPDELDRYFRAE